jgi:plasmid stability protein
MQSLLAKEVSMATITVRNLDDEIKELLRISAAKNGHSMEEEARMILKQALVKKPPRYGLGTWMHQHFAEFGGVELDISPRDAVPPRIVSFDDEDGNA